MLLLSIALRLLLLLITLECTELTPVAAAVDSELLVLLMLLDFPFGLVSAATTAD